MLKYLRIPYKHLGRDFSGCDCLGLVRLYYENELGVTLPDYTDYEKNWHLKDAKLVSKLYADFGFTKVYSVKINDILLLNESTYPKHLAVVVNNGFMLHTTENGTVCHSYLQGFWFDKIHSIYRRG